MTRALAVVVAGLLLTTACFKSPPEHVTLSVLAASSLTNVFSDLGEQFHEKTSATVTLSFAASSTLARQIADGQPADVFASAAQQDMQGLVTHHLVAEPADFARNTLEIAVQKDNPRHIRGLADLGARGTAVVLCASTVPCGRLADAVLSRVHEQVGAASREENVKAVLTKVALGEADAGIVYASDITSAPGGVRGVPIPVAQNAATRYPIAVLAHSAEASVATSFVSFVLSATGQRTLRRYGFAAP